MAETAKQHLLLVFAGYYARTAALKQLIHQFLSSGQCPKQVLSLGAGFDTTWFHLKVSRKTRRNAEEIHEAFMMSMTRYGIVRSEYGCPNRNERGLVVE